MGMGSESFLGLYELGDPGLMHHLCVGVDNYNPDLLAGRLSNLGIQAKVNRGQVNRTSGGDQLYFNDPERILVQLAQYGYLGLSYLSGGFSHFCSVCRGAVRVVIKASSCLS